MFSHLSAAEANPFGSSETVREVNSRKTAGERAAIDAAADAALAAVEAAAAERAAKLDAAPFVVPEEWDAARRGYGHDIRDAAGVPVAVVAAYVWREATGLRTLDPLYVGDFVATREGFAPEGGPLVNVSSHSIEWCYSTRYETETSATSDWLPAGATTRRSAYEPHVAAMWIDLLGDATDVIELRKWQAAREAKAAKATKTSAKAPANTFAALAALQS
jgi:hypothetical protein